MVEPTATPVPEEIVPTDLRDNWPGYLMEHPGYQQAWGTPMYGGTLRLTGPAAVNSSQAARGWSAFINLNQHANNGLLMYDPWLQQNDGVFCDLCETWEISEDGTKVTVKLQEGVKFQSEGYYKDKGAPASAYGAELVCKDVKASMEWWARPPDETSGFTRSMGKMQLAHLGEVTCPDGADGYTAVLNFTHFRNPTMAFLATGMGIWNKEYREWMDEANPGLQSTANNDGFMINHGTGPYIPVSADMPEGMLKVKKNPNYWIEGAPFLDGMEFFPILDYNTKYTSWITGKVDHVGHGSSGLTKAQVVQVQQRYPDLKVYIKKYCHIQQVMMNPERPPFDVWKVRYAVHLAMDRGAWFEFNKAGPIDMATPTYLFCAGTPADLFYRDPEQYYKEPGYRLAGKDEDIAEANRLLDEVFGTGNRPSDTEFTVWSLLSRREIGIWAIDQLKESLNWDVVGKFVESGENRTKINEATYQLLADAAPAHRQLFTSDASEPLGGAHSEIGLAAHAYIWGWKGTDEGLPIEPEIERINALVMEQDVEQDLAKRAEQVAYLERYIVEERTNWAVLGAMNTAWGYHLKVRGVFHHDVGMGTEYRLYDRYWINEDLNS